MAATIPGTWTKLATADALQRSSHTVSALGDTVYIFGGELKPREPRDNDVHTLKLSGGGATAASGNASMLPTEWIREKQVN